MLLVPVATPRVVEELPTESGSTGGEEANVAALEKAVEDKYSKLRSWRMDSTPAGVKPAPRVGHTAQPVHSHEDEDADTHNEDDEEAAQEGGGAPQDDDPLDEDDGDDDGGYSGSDLDDYD